MAFLGLRRWLVARREMYFSSKAGIGAGSSGSGRHERRQRRRQRGGSGKSCDTRTARARRPCRTQKGRCEALLGPLLPGWGGLVLGFGLEATGGACSAALDASAVLSDDDDEGFQGAKGSMPALASHCMRLLLRVCPSQAPGDALQHGDWSKSCPGS